MRASVVLACTLVACDGGASSDLLAPVRCFDVGASRRIERFGATVALSDDGTTLAIGAPGSEAIGDQEGHVGGVYIFTRTQTEWVQQAYVPAPSADNGDVFGSSLALSADGTVLAVGAPGEDSAAIGIGGDELDNSAVDAGAAFVFARDTTGWSEQAFIKASNTEAGDRFGQTLALSDDGATLAVAAYLESSASGGVDGDQSNNAALGAGAVYVFSRTGNTWMQEAYVKASNPDAGDTFGYRAVALSGDGSTLAVGARNDASAATGVDGDASDNSMPDAGAVYVFARAASTWTQHAYVKASNTNRGDFFGSSIALSSDGATLAVGAIGERSAAIGVNGNQDDNSIVLAGAVYLFTRTQSSWFQDAYVKVDREYESEIFGDSVALSADGSRLGATNQPAVHMFARTDGTWSREPIASAPAPSARFALSGDGATLAVGTVFQAGFTTNNCTSDALGSGVVYLFSPPPAP